MKILVLVCLRLALNLSPVPVEADELRNVRCAMPNFSAEFENSAPVFAGEVIKVCKGGDTKSFVFRVEEFWKGIESREATVLVAENPRFQARFEKGKKYLVFAKENEDDGSLFDGRCSRSAEIDGCAGTLKDDLESPGEAKTCIDLKEVGSK